MALTPVRTGAVCPESHLWWKFFGMSGVWLRLLADADRDLNLGAEPVLRSRLVTPGRAGSPEVSQAR